MKALEQKVARTGFLSAANIDSQSCHRGLDPLATAGIAGFGLIDWEMTLYLTQLSKADCTTLLAAVENSMVGVHLHLPTTGMEPGSPLSMAAAALVVEDPLAKGVELSLSIGIVGNTVWAGLEVAGAQRVTEVKRNVLLHKLRHAAVRSVRCQLQ